MTEFKIGDRVRVVETGRTIDSYLIGQLGAIRYAPVNYKGMTIQVLLDVDKTVRYFHADEIEKWFDEPDTTAEQDAIDLAYARGYQDGYAQGADDGYESGRENGLGW